MQKCTTCGRIIEDPTISACYGCRTPLIKLSLLEASTHYLRQALLSGGQLVVGIGIIVGAILLVVAIMAGMLDVLGGEMLIRVGIAAIVFAIIYAFRRLVTW